MSIRNIKARMHEAVDALPDDVKFSSRTDDIAAMKGLLLAVYSELASYAWHCGASDGDYLQREAVPASEAIEEAFFGQPMFPKVYRANHVHGASL